jgi:hypothetical protein
MPSINHEAPIELLRRNPLLAAALLHGTGVLAPTGGRAQMAPGDLSSALPAELRADAVIVLDPADPQPGDTKGRLVVVVESQTRLDGGKHRVWPAYLALARAQHDCPAVLLVICPDRNTGRWARQRIATGHPGFDLVPLVIDADSTPEPDAPDLAQAAPELAVLGALTGAVDLDQEAGRRLVLTAIAAADLDEDRLETYTHLIRAVASTAARNALEALMTIAFKDDFIDRIKAEGKAEGRTEGKAEGRTEGKAEGRAEMLLQVLRARGFEVPDAVRDQVLSCTDLAQLQAWGSRAATASSLEDVFQG